MSVVGQLIEERGHLQRTIVKMQREINDLTAKNDQLTKRLGHAERVCREVGACIEVRPAMQASLLGKIYEDWKKHDNAREHSG